MYDTLPFSNFCYEDILSTWNNLGILKLQIQQIAKRAINAYKEFINCKKRQHLLEIKYPNEIF